MTPSAISFRCRLSRVLAVAGAVLVGGCVSYETTSGPSTTEVLRDGLKSRSMAVGNVQVGAVTVSVRDTWQQQVRETTEVDGEFEVESSLSMIGEAPEMIVLSPLLLALDVLAVVVTGPVAGIEALVSGADVRESTREVVAPVADLVVNVAGSSWRIQAATDATGSCQFSLREPAAQALRRGVSLDYRVEAEGQEAVVRSLTIPETLACAELPRSESLQRRLANWASILADCPPGEVRQSVEWQAERIDPATLRRYRQERLLPDAMALEVVELYREQVEIHARAVAARDYSAASGASARQASLLAGSDAGRAELLRARSVQESADYVLDYYAERSLRSTPTFLVELCGNMLPQARRFRDGRSGAVFTAVLAVHASDPKEILGGRTGLDGTVAQFQDRALGEIQEQAARAAYAAEVARIKREEEAWHYRYLNGRGGRGSEPLTGSDRAQLGSRGPAGPNIAEQERAHRAWLQSQQHAAANRNRAFDQYDR